MIDDKKIEEATRDYINKNGYFVKYDEEPCTDIEFAYKAGAHWIIEQLLNLWHHKGEVPDGRILYINDTNFPYGMEWFRDDHWDEDWDAIIDIEQIKGWIYVKDLLPMMKKCLD